MTDLERKGSIENREVARLLVASPLALQGLSELVVLHVREERSQSHRLIVSDTEFAQRWATLEEPFDSVAAYVAFDDELITPGGTSPFRGCATAGDLLRTVRSRFILGRPFSREELRDESRVAIVSRSFWVRHRGQRPDVIGTTISTAGGPLQIVGLLSDESVYPPRTEVWRPRERYRGPGRFYLLTVVARLKKGWTSALATEAVNLHAPSERRQNSLKLVPLAEDTLGDSKVQSAGAAVLLAVTALALAVNLFHMSLARGVARRRRTYVAISLGATRANLLLATLTQQCLIWLCGGLLAPLVSVALLKVILPNTPLAGSLTLEVLFWRALRWQVPLLASLAPIMAAVQFFGQQSPNRVGGAELRGFAERGKRRWLGAVALSQAMFAASLLVITSGVVKAGANIESTSIGVAEQGLWTFRVVLPPSGYPTPAERLRFCTLLLTELRRIPGVTAADAGVIPILAVPASDDWRLDEESDRPQQRFVTPGYLSALGVRIASGRLFNPSDRPEEGAAVVNEEYVRRFGGSGPVVGKAVKGLGRRQIIGVVSNIRDLDIWVRPRPLVYLPFDGKSGQSLTFALRSSESQKAVTYPEVRAALSRVDAGLAIREFEPLRNRLDRARAPWRARALLAGYAAVVGLCLLLSGVHSILTFVMLEQRRHLAIRVALGAETASLARVLATRLVAPVGCGATVGVLVGWLGLVMLRWQLYGVSSAFAALSVLPALFVPGAAVLLSVRAARNAARADLTGLLRAE